MKNEIFREADRLALPVPDGTKSGDPVLVGALVGVAATAKGEGGNLPENASVWTKGAFDLPVTTAATVGQALYITSGGALTNSGSGNTLFGYALEAKSATTAPIPVKLAQV